MYSVLERDAVSTDLLGLTMQRCTKAQWKSMQGPFDKEDLIQMELKLHLNQVFFIEYNCLALSTHAPNLV